MQERKDQMIKEKHGRMLWENFEELIFLLPNYLASYFNLVLMMKATFFSAKTCLLDPCQFFSVCYL